MVEPGGMGGAEGGKEGGGGEGGGGKGGGGEGGGGEGGGDCAERQAASAAACVSQKRVASLSHLYHLPSLHGSAWSHLPVHSLDDTPLKLEEKHEEEEEDALYAWAVHSSGASSQHLLYPMLPHAMQVPPLRRRRPGGRNRSCLLLIELDRGGGEGGGGEEAALIGAFSS